MHQHLRAFIEVTSAAWGRERAGPRDDPVGAPHSTMTPGSGAARANLLRERT